MDQRTDRCSGQAQLTQGTHHTPAAARGKPLWSPEAPAPSAGPGPQVTPGIQSPPISKGEYPGQYKHIYDHLENEKTLDFSYIA